MILLTLFQDASHVALISLKKARIFLLKKFCFWKKKLIPKNSTIIRELEKRGVSKPFRVKLSFSIQNRKQRGRRVCQEVTRIASLLSRRETVTIFKTIAQALSRSSPPNSGRGDKKSDFENGSTIFPKHFFQFSPRKQGKNRTQREAIVVHWIFQLGADFFFIL